MFEYFPFNTKTMTNTRHSIIQALVAMLALESSVQASFHPQRAVRTFKWARVAQTKPCSRGPLRAKSGFDYQFADTDRLLDSVLADKTSGHVAAMKSVLEETSQKASDFSGLMISGVDGMMDDAKMNMQSSVVKISPEAILAANKEFVDSLNEQFSSEGIRNAQQSLSEFCKYYFESLESRYHFSEFSVVNWMNSITTLGTKTADALEFETYGMIYLLVATVFWALIQKRDGVEEGKALAGKQILKLEAEVIATKHAAMEETEVKASEILDLRQQMDSLQEQVTALTMAAKELSSQLEGSKNTAAQQSPAAASVPEPVREAEENAVVDEPTSDIKLEAPKEVETDVETKTAATLKGKRKRAASAPVPAKKKNAGKQETKSFKKAEVTMNESNGAEESEAKPVEEAVVTISAAADDVESEEITQKGSIQEKNGKIDVTGTPDWASLALSTLKRKTVKELAGYLSEKGIEVTGTDGKTLKKDSLVELVLSH